MLLLSSQKRNKINLQPILEDNYIIIKPLGKEHFDLLYDVAKDPLIWVQHPSKDRYKKEVYAEFFKASIESKGAFIIMDKSTGGVIGSTRFKRINNDENSVEIGWSFLSRDRWAASTTDRQRNS